MIAVPAMLVEPAPDPWRRALEQRWHHIRDEALALSAAQWLAWGQRQYNVASGASIAPLCMRYHPSWLTADLGQYRTWCPRTASLLHDLPGVFTLAFSRLAPGARVLPHRDLEEPGYLRFHLGLDTVAGARMRIGDRWHEWGDGCAIAFDPTTEHEVVHDGNRPRIVLLMDVEAQALRRAT
jgi:beta-hydroxylase